MAGKSIWWVGHGAWGIGYGERERGKGERLNLSLSPFPFNLSPISPSPHPPIPLTPLPSLLDLPVLVPKEFDFLHGGLVTLSNFANAIDLPYW